MTKSLIDGAVAGRIFSRGDAETVMEELLTGRVETPDIVRLLRAMNTRPVRVEELAGFASVMRRHAARVFPEGEPQPRHLVDTCGTGGKGFATFNISTAAAIVASAAGAQVAKHGNRASYSGSGSADVIEALGVNIDLPVEHFGRAIREIGIGFFFARAAHAAARHAAPARKEIGVRTVFNLLGPLTNPAGARSQVVGVPSPDLIDLVAATLAVLGVEHAFVVHGAGGLDEISLAGETLVAEIKGGRVRRFTVAPEDFGVSRAPIDAVRGGTAAENAATIRDILAGKDGPRRDIVLVNAAAALVAAGVAPNFSDGAQLAKAALASGAARDKLAALVDFTRQSE
ncbi:MAG TPA: anthranilate phosphoribosyltransferase [Candidatus Acidoferrum sp.]|nr:anthranilate phosphoribosyltransferase [Candidatus Acidoferrum sp.]